MDWLTRRRQPLLPSGYRYHMQCFLSRRLATAPTTAFSEFILGHHSQQLGHIDEVGLIDRQLIGALSDFCTNPDGPCWKS